MYGTIDIIDQSGGDSDLTVKELGLVVTALQAQLTHHVQPSYRYVSTAVRHVGKPSPGAWPIYILKDPDTAGALGYHDVDPRGVPYGRVFTSVSREAGVSLSSVLSHEVIEAFVDPYANDWSDQGTTCIAHEACDPVQNSSYLINNVEVSNFVTREWFDAASVGGKYDWLDHLHHPFELEHGGYLIKMKDGKVSQQFGEDAVDLEGADAYRTHLLGVPQPSRTVWRQVRQLI